MKSLNNTLGAAAAMPALAAASSAGFEVKSGERFEFKNDDPDTLAKGIHAIGRRFEEFKQQNDARLAQIEKRGEDPITAETVDKLNAEITRLGERFEDMQKSKARERIQFKGREISQAAEDHRKSFGQWAREGNNETELKSMTGTVNADGGFTVPEVIDDMITSLLVDISPVRSVANVVKIGTTDYKRLVNVRGTASGWVADTAARTETNTPQFAEVAPTMGDLYANPAATQNILNDSMFDLESWLAGEVATEFARAEGAAFISGNGTNKPTGFLTGTPVATADASRAFGVLQYTASGGASALPTSFDQYIDLVNSLKAGHRANAVFMASRTTYSSIRKIKATDGQYLWVPSPQLGIPNSMLGYPAVEAEDMPAVAANAFPVAFGNFRAGYTIVDRQSAITLRDPYTNKPYVHFYTVKRVGGKVVDSEAIKLLKVAAS